MLLDATNLLNKCPYNNKLPANTMLDVTADPEEVLLTGSPFSFRSVRGVPSGFLQKGYSEAEKAYRCYHNIISSLWLHHATILTRAWRSSCLAMSCMNSSVESASDILAGQKLA